MNERRLRFEDVRATVWPDSVPDSVDSELALLYRNPYATLERFVLFDHVDRAGMGTCCLDGPRHIILFTRRGRTVTVLNKLVPIAVPDMERLVHTLRRAFRDVGRLDLETTCDPASLRRPHWVTGRDHDFVIEPPGSADAWARSLGTKTRKNIRNFSNRLTRDHPGWEQRWVAGDHVRPEHVEEVAHWTRERMRTKDLVSGLDAPGMTDNVLAMVRRYGGAFETVIDGRVAARELCLHMGDACWIEWGSFDRRFEPYELGLISLYGAIRRFVGLGATIHLLWGTAEFKRRLGATEHRQWQLSLYGSRLDKWLDVAQARRAVRCAARGSRIDRSWQRWRWRAHRAKELLLRR